MSNMHGRAYSGGDSRHYKASLVDSPLVGGQGDDGDQVYDVSLPKSASDTTALTRSHRVNRDASET